MNRRYCDRCGKEIHPGVCKNHRLHHACPYFPEINGADSYEDYNYSLCMDCAEAFKLWMGGAE